MLAKYPVAVPTSSTLLPVVWLRMDLKNASQRSVSGRDQASCLSLRQELLRSFQYAVILLIIVIMLTGTNLSILSAIIAGIYVISPISLFWIFILLASAANINIIKPMHQRSNK
ncbi:hypothetical protein D3C81_1576390 [compost metagenome]